MRGVHVLIQLVLAVKSAVTEPAAGKREAWTSLGEKMMAMVAGLQPSATAGAAARHQQRPATPWHACTRGAP